MGKIGSDLLWVHVFSVFAMTGILWLVQAVQYPLFGEVDSNSFQRFHSEHSRRITYIVGPLILSECVSGLLLCILEQPNALAITQLDRRAWFGLSSACFLFTGLVSVPLHHQLSRGFSFKVHRQLVRTNWVRTALWTIHSAWILKVMRSLL